MSAYIFVLSVVFLDQSSSFQPYFSFRTLSQGKLMRTIFPIVSFYMPQFSCFERFILASLAKCFFCRIFLLFNGLVFAFRRKNWLTVLALHKLRAV